MTTAVTLRQGSLLRASFQASHFMDAARNRSVQYVHITSCREIDSPPF